MYVLKYIPLFLAHN